MARPPLPALAAEVEWLIGAVRIAVALHQLEPRQRVKHVRADIRVAARQGDQKIRLLDVEAARRDGIGPQNDRLLRAIDFLERDLALGEILAAARGQDAHSKPSVVCFITV